MRLYGSIHAISTLVDIRPPDIIIDTQPDRLDFHTGFCFLESAEIFRLDIFNNIDSPRLKLGKTYRIVRYNPEHDTRDSTGLGKIIQRVRIQHDLLLFQPVPKNIGACTQRLLVKRRMPELFRRNTFPFVLWKRC